MQSYVQIATHFAHHALAITNATNARLAILGMRRLYSVNQFAKLANIGTLKMQLAKIVCLIVLRNHYSINNYFFKGVLPQQIANNAIKAIT